MRLGALQISGLDAAWLAGILEGEGCFDTHGNSPRVRVKMTDKDVVERAAQMMGGRVNENRWYRREGKKPQWEAAVTGAWAYNVMVVVRPFMGARRGEKIDELMALYLGRPFQLSLFPL